VLEVVELESPGLRFVSVVVTRTLSSKISRASATRSSCRLLSVAVVGCADALDPSASNAFSPCRDSVNFKVSRFGVQARDVAASDKVITAFGKKSAASSPCANGPLSLASTEEWLGFWGGLDSSKLVKNR